MHDGEGLFFAVGVGGLGFLPINQHGLDTAARFSLEDEGLVGKRVIFDKGGNFMDVFFLSGEKRFMMVMCNGGLAGTGIERNLTQCSGCIDRRVTFFQWEWFRGIGLRSFGQLGFTCRKYFPCNQIRFREVLLQSFF